MYPTLADSLRGRRINPWFDPNEARPRQRTTTPSTPEPTAPHPILMAARARRARRLKQLARVEASQEATA